MGSPPRQRPTPSDPERVQQLLREAERLHGRFVREVVEGEVLCPWAREARLTARSSIVAMAVEPGSAEVADLYLRAVESPTTDVLQVVFPLELGTAREWARRIDAVTGALQARCAGGGELLAAAAFHPDWTWSEADAAALVPAFRRSPFAAVQWTRLRVLAEARGPGGADRYVTRAEANALLNAVSGSAVSGSAVSGGAVSGGASGVSDSAPNVAERNFIAARRGLLPRIEAALADIYADRDRLLAGLGYRSA